MSSLAPVEAGPVASPTWEEEGEHKTLRPVCFAPVTRPGAKEDTFLAGSLCCQDPGSCHPCHPGLSPDPAEDRRRSYIHGIGGDQKVSVVKECDAGHLDNEHIDELDGQHEHQLPNAADLQEHGAGQQAEQHTVGEVLEREGLSDPMRPWASLAPPHLHLTW